MHRDRRSCKLYINADINTQIQASTTKWKRSRNAEETNLCSQKQWEEQTGSKCIYLYMEILTVHSSFNKGQHSLHIQINSIFIRFSTTFAPIDNTSQHIDSIIVGTHKRTPRVPLTGIYTSLRNPSADITFVDDSIVRRFVVTNLS